MTKKRAKAYWKLLKDVKDFSDVEATLAVEVIKVMNNLPTRKRKRKGLTCSETLIQSLMK